MKKSQSIRKKIVGLHPNALCVKGLSRNTKVAFRILHRLFKFKGGIPWTVTRRGLFSFGQHVGYPAPMIREGILQLVELGYLIPRTASMSQFEATNLLLDRYLAPQPPVRRKSLQVSSRQRDARQLVGASV